MPHLLSVALVGTVSFILSPSDHIPTEGPNAGSDSSSSKASPDQTARGSSTQCPYGGARSGVRTSGAGR